MAILRKKGLHCFCQSSLLSFEICFQRHSFVKMGCFWLKKTTHEKLENNKFIKWPLGDVFSSCLVIFPATLSPFCQSYSGSQLSVSKRINEQNKIDNERKKVKAVTEYMNGIVSLGRPYTDVLNSYYEVKVGVYMYA